MLTTAYFDPLCSLQQGLIQIVNYIIFTNMVSRTTSNDWNLLVLQVKLIHNHSFLIKWWLGYYQILQKMAKWPPFGQIRLPKLSGYLWMQVKFVQTHCVSKHTAHLKPASHSSSSKSKNNCCLYIFCICSFCNVHWSLWGAIKVPAFMYVWFFGTPHPN